MQVARLPNSLQLTFSTVECAALLTALRTIHQHYQVKPSDLDPATRQAWYSTRGCQSAGMNPEEIQEWIANLHHLRSQNAQAIQNWIQQLHRPLGPPYQLTFPLPQAASLLSVLNDHRLLLASRHHLGQTEMALDLTAGTQSLPSAQIKALCEIHILAYIIETILQHLPSLSGDEPENG